MDRSSEAEASMREMTFKEIVSPLDLNWNEADLSGSKPYIVSDPETSEPITDKGGNEIVDEAYSLQIGGNVIALHREKPDQAKEVIHQLRVNGHSELVDYWQGNFSQMANENNSADKELYEFLSKPRESLE
jgi:hypothetical protein